MTTAGPRRVPQGRAKIDNNRTLVAQLELTDLTPSKQLLMMKLYTVPMVGLLPVAPCSMLSGGLQFIAVFCYSRFNYPCTRYEKPDHPVKNTTQRVVGLAAGTHEPHGQNEHPVVVNRDTLLRHCTIIERSHLP